METRKIIGDIRKLVGAGGYQTKLCKVVSVQDDNTCTVQAYSGERYEKITINAEITKNKGIFITPKVGSFVLITMKDEVHGFISQFSDIDKLFIKIQDFELELKEGNLKVKGKKVEGDFEEITFNGGENGGLTITPELKKQLDKSKARIDGIIDAINNAKVTPQDGGLGLQSTMVAALKKLADKEDYGNIENGKIKH